MNRRDSLPDAIRHVVNVCGSNTVTVTLSAEDALSLARDLDLAAVGFGRPPITSCGVVGKITGPAKGG